MSFCVNNTELATINYNSMPASSVYYNGTKVWPYEFESSSWGEVYDLWQQHGTMTEEELNAKFPIGAKKAINLSTAVLGTSGEITATLMARKYGYLHFITEPLAEPITFGSFMYYPEGEYSAYARCPFVLSNLYNVCQNFDNSCDIKTVMKQWSDEFNYATSSGGSYSKSVHKYFRSMPVNPYVVKWSPTPPGGISFAWPIGDYSWCPKDGRVYWTGGNSGGGSNANGILSPIGVRYDIESETYVYEEISRSQAAYFIPHFTIFGGY